MKAVQLRHVEGPKGVFRVNETEYQCNVALDDSKHVAVLIRSNLKEVVSQQHIVFDALWNKATPAEQKIIEMQGEKRKPEEGENQVTISRENATGPVLDIIIEQQKANEKSEKETEVRIISQNPDYNKYPHHLHSTIQLWSNSSNSEYAIRLERERGFLTGTTENLTTAQYTDLEEVDYLENLKYDWKYTLKQWISNRYHHDNDTTQDDKKTLSSDSHTTATSTVRRANDEKTNANIKFSDEKLKNDDNFRIDSSNMNKRTGCNRCSRSDAISAN